MNPFSSQFPSFQTVKLFFFFLNYHNKIMKTNMIKRVSVVRLDHF